MPDIQKIMNWPRRFGLNQIRGFGVIWLLSSSTVLAQEKEPNCTWDENGKVASCKDTQQNSSTNPTYTPNPSYVPEKSSSSDSDWFLNPSLGIGSSIPLFQDPIRNFKMAAELRQVGNGFGFGLGVTLAGGTLYDSSSNYYSYRDFQIPLNINTNLYPFAFSVLGGLGQIYVVNAPPNTQDSIPYFGYGLSGGITINRFKLDLEWQKKSFFDYPLTIKSISLNFSVGILPHNFSDDG